jgi:lipoprotein-releasing system permease protein
MKTYLWLAYRYLKAKRKNKFIKLVTYITIAGVTLGVSALIVVIAVMNGFDNELEKKIIGINSHLILKQDPVLEDISSVSKKLKKSSEVISYSPFVLGNGTIMENDLIINIFLKGINLHQEENTTKIKKYLKSSISKIDEDEIIVGNVLADKLNLKVGSRIRILIPQILKEERFKVKGIFNSGMYEYDLTIAFINLRRAQTIFQLGNSVTGIGIKIKDPYRAEEVKRELSNLIGYPYYILSWIDMNKNLFSALKLEKTAMFIILALIVLVAAFNIASILIMSVLEKVKDIGILRAIGINRKTLMRIFIWKGLFIGVIGIFLGALIGFFLIYILKTYPIIKLPSDIYYIDRLPVAPSIKDNVLILFSALIITFIATIYPAIRAARLEPIICLRHE